jgi:hypothetical protein
MLTRSHFQGPTRTLCFFSNLRSILLSPLPICARILRPHTPIETKTEGILFGIVPAGPAILDSAVEPLACKPYQPSSRSRLRGWSKNSAVSMQHGCASCSVCNSKDCRRLYQFVKMSARWRALLLQSRVLRLALFPWLFPFLKGPKRF